MEPKSCEISIEIDDSNYKNKMITSKQQPQQTTARAENGKFTRRKSYSNSVRSMLTSKSEVDDEEDDLEERTFHSETQSIPDLTTLSLYPTIRPVRPRKKEKKSASGYCFEAQSYVYKFLNQPSHMPAILYHLLMLCALVFYTGLFLFTDRDTWHTMCHRRLPIKSQRHELRFLFETILILYNLLEFLVRLWSSRSLPIYVSMPMFSWLLSYLSRLSHIFDVILIASSLAIVPCYTPIPQDVTYIVLILIVLRAFHRLFNVAQWTSAHLRESPWKLMIEVFQEQGSILLGVIYLEILLVCFMAYSVFVVENLVIVANESTGNVTAKMSNMVDGLYWSSITLATIGYGDYYPLSYVSKLITFVCLIISMSLYSLPSGVIATSLALKINAKEQIEKRKSQRNCAALLIQTFWRLRRREKRFHLATVLWNQVQQTHAHQENVKSKIKMAKRFKAKVRKIIAKRDEYYAYRFVQLARIEVLKKDFETLSDHSLRTSIQCHWMEHRALTSLLDTIRIELDQKFDAEDEDKLEDEAKMNEHKNKQSIHRWNDIQRRLAKLHKLASDQQAWLKTQLDE